VLYVTPEKFRVAGTGIDLDGIDDVELVSILSRASASVNSYTAAPQLPQPHDFRGGTITGERHEWNLYSERRRYYPWHTPLQAISGFQINVSEDAFVTINPDQLFINLSGNYVEVVAMALGIGIFPIVANLSLNTPVSQMDYTYGYTFPVVNETLYETDGNTFRAQNQWWTGEVEVRVNDTPLDSGDYTVDTDEGTVLITNDLVAGDVVKADYSHRLPQNIAEATTVIARDHLEQRSLTSKGLGGLLEVQVAEVRLRRPTPTATLMRDDALRVPEEAKVLLAPYIFRSVGG
jgi:hypothetical protein